MTTQTRTPIEQHAISPLSDSGHRSRRYGGLRLANLERGHVCAAQVSRAGAGAVSESGAVSTVRALSSITDRVRRCAEDGGAGALERGKVAHRSAQNWSA